jgi:hypothetical protein
MDIMCPSCGLHSSDSSQRAWFTLTNVHDNTVVIFDSFSCLSFWAQERHREHDDLPDWIVGSAWG